jgi:adenosylcobinamide kinase/adenosylcobinamide-phosphate guanylyltransferase
VVVDCVTLWLTNLLFAATMGNTGSATAASATSAVNIDATLKTAQEEFDRLTAQDATFIFVTNEIGSGGVSDNALQRQFTDLEGWMNQYIARRADEVILMVSGIAVKIK